jgi:hypothetical protein
VILKPVPKAGHECSQEKMDQREPRKDGTKINAAYGIFLVDSKKQA